MTAITTTPAAHVEDLSTTKGSRSAALRRGFFVASPILAGFLTRQGPARDAAGRARIG